MLGLGRNLLNVTRQYSVWIEPDNPENVMFENMPYCWNIITGEEDLYGFPMWKGMGSPFGMKAATGIKGIKEEGKSAESIV